MIRPPTIIVKLYFFFFLVLPFMFSRSRLFQPGTQVLLREQTRTPLRDGDTAGYIYGLQIEGSYVSSPSIAHRPSMSSESCPSGPRTHQGRPHESWSRYMVEHLHNCSSGRPTVLGYYLTPRNKTRGAPPCQSESSLVTGSHKVQCSATLKDLIHLEFPDITTNALPSGDVIPGHPWTCLLPFISLVSVVFRHPR